MKAFKELKFDAEICCEDSFNIYPIKTRKSLVIHSRAKTQKNENNIIKNISNIKEPMRQVKKSNKTVYYNKDYDIKELQIQSSLYKSDYSIRNATMQRVSHSKKESNKVLFTYFNLKNVIELKSLKIPLFQKSEYLELDLSFSEDFKGLILFPQLLTRYSLLKYVSISLKGEQNKKEIDNVIKELIYIISRFKILQALILDFRSLERLSNGAFKNLPVQFSSLQCLKCFHFITDLDTFSFDIKILSSGIENLSSKLESLKLQCKINEQSQINQLASTLKNFTNLQALDFSFILSKQQEELNVKYMYNLISSNCFLKHLKLRIELIQLSIEDFVTLIQAINQQKELENLKLNIKLCPMKFEDKWEQAHQELQKIQVKKLDLIFNFSKLQVKLIPTFIPLELIRNVVEFRLSFNTLVLKEDFLLNFSQLIKQCTYLRILALQFYDGDCKSIGDDINQLWVGLTYPQELQSIEFILVKGNRKVTSLGRLKRFRYEEEEEEEQGLARAGNFLLQKISYQLPRIKKLRSLSLKFQWSSLIITNQGLKWFSDGLVKCQNLKSVELTFLGSRMRTEEVENNIQKLNNVSYTIYSN